MPGRGGVLILSRVQGTVSIFIFFNKGSGGDGSVDTDRVMTKNIIK